MSLFGAMFAGVSGLNANAQSMGMIADNIANVNTVGFKGSEVQFSTLVTRAATKTTFSPGGVQANTVQLIDRQGLIQASTSKTDMAVVGKGFFVINEAAVPTATDEYFYSRAGSFSPDKDGYLRNTSGFFLMGWPTNNLGVPTAGNLSTLSSLQSIDVSGISGNAVQTTTMTIGANLPADAAINSTQNTSAQIFDSLGIPENLNLTYTKTASNTWGVSALPPSGASLLTLTNSASQVTAASGLIDFNALPATADTIDILGTTYTFIAGVTAGTDIQTGVSLTQTITDLVAAVGDARITQGSGANNTRIEIVQTAVGGAIAVDATATPNILQSNATFTVPATAAVGNLVFSGAGVPSTLGVANAAITYTNGANASAIALNFGTVGQADGMTQFDSTFVTYFIQQNGVRFGTFSEISIDDNGVVTAIFDNGQTTPIFKVPLATFSNANGLEKKTGNVFRESDSSGTVLLNQAGTGSAGGIAPSALEASNVDIAEEFTNMIITQRAYTASARIISTVDEMLEEVTRIAR